MTKFQTTIRKCGTAFTITTLNKVTGKEDVVDLSAIKDLFNPVSGRFTSRGKETMEVASRLLCELHGIRHHQRPRTGGDGGTVIAPPTKQQRAAIRKAVEDHEPISASQQVRVERKPL